MAELKLINASSEIGAGTRGASLGIQALKVAAWKNGSAFLGRVEEQLVVPFNDALYHEDDNPFAHRIEHLVGFEQKLSEEIIKTLSSNRLACVVGGDHSISIGSVSGTAASSQDARLGVVWIDAHADLHSPFTTPSGNVHGMPLAALLDFDNTDQQRNDPSPETRAAWEQLQDIGMKGPKLRASDLVFIALRDTEVEEDRIIAENGIKVIRVKELRENGPDWAVRETLEHLKKCELLHISFDVDSLDTSISKGTGTPVDDGLFLDEASTILNGLMNDERSKTLDVVEINPTLDNENRMAEAVLPLLDKVYEVIRAR